MLTARHGRLLVFALVVHFALLLPAADLAHGSAHPEDTGCDVCLQLGSFQHGVTPSAASVLLPRLAAAPFRPLPVTRERTTPARATARGPPSA